MTHLKLDASFVAATVKSLADLLVDNYVFPEIAALMKQGLLDKLSEGDFDMEESGTALAGKITDYLRQLSNDNHLGFFYSEQPLPVQSDRTKVSEDMNRIA